MLVEPKDGRERERITIPKAQTPFLRQARQVFERVEGEGQVGRVPIAFAGWNWRRQIGIDLGPQIG
jgi:hypothetical protein